MGSWNGQTCNTLMPKQTIQDVLENLHDLTAERLIALIEKEDCDAATIRAAAAFLKDNGIDVTTRKVKDLEESFKVVNLPFQEEEAMGS